MNTGISLSVCRDVRRMPLIWHASRDDETAKHLRDMVIGQGRFGRRCHFCDFSFGSSEFFEIHHLDGDHSNEDPSNCVPICEMCHAPFHLDTVSRKWQGDSDWDSGAIIFFPELSQPELNNLVQAIFYAMAVNKVGEENESDTKPLVKPHTIYGELFKRKDLVEKDTSGSIVRAGLAQPFALSKVLINMSDAEYAQRDELLSGLRYLPPQQYFITQAQGWNAKECAFSKLDLAAWPSIAG